MEGEMQRKTRSKASRKPKKTEKQTVEDEDNAIEHEEEDTLQTSISIIYAEIKAIQSDVKTELNNFHEILSRDMKADLANFRTDINTKLNEITTDLKDTMGRLEQACQEGNTGLKSELHLSVREKVNCK
ncbi:hypothetical protein ROHU_003177 [Labeo rohita]|uniref:Uncharacterized protein n=1 Tax=Labeo rohita TaxID=84645 RepID=A0A498NWC2_LABRO|nr:hypothetical protein ROHU_007632 [Labeo rohita]RXN36181.1 hypothetical protein ROHU_003177 [Labeo rohita]